MSRNLAARFFLACVCAGLFCGDLEGASISLAWTPSGASVPLAWNPSPYAGVFGYHVYIGRTTHIYDSILDAGTNNSITINGLEFGSTYYFAVTSYDISALDSMYSGELRVECAFRPMIMQQPYSQTAQAGASAILSVDVIGTPPVTFQWYRGITPIRGATGSVLRLSNLSDADSANYTVIVGDPAGNVTSAAANVTVIDPNPAPPPPLTNSPPPTLTAGISQAAGIYNGLFFQTNSAGQPAIDLQTTGLSIVAL